MPFDFGNRTLAAPLAGVSNSVYRRWARRFGAELVFTEMASAEGLRRNDRQTHKLLHYTEFERPIFAQIFDDTPEALFDAAKIVEELGFDGIDVNLGCPAKKVVAKGAGAALLKNVPNAVEAVESVVRAVRIPVSAKMRSGWSNGDESAFEIIEALNSMDIAFVTLHPRSREMMFRGKADWSLISRAMETAKMPVIGNGDIFCAADAINMVRQTNCAAVMIGRASMGNPWIFEEVSTALSGRIAPPTPDATHIIRVCREYIEDLVDYFGDYTGSNLAKKHTVWFTSGLPMAKSLRINVFKANCARDIFDALGVYEDNLEKYYDESVNLTKAVKCL